MTTTAANPVKHPIRRFIPGILPHRHIWYWRCFVDAQRCCCCLLHIYLLNYIRQHNSDACILNRTYRTAQPENHIACTDYYDSSKCLCINNSYVVYANAGFDADCVMRQKKHGKYKRLRVCIVCSFYWCWCGKPMPKFKRLMLNWLEIKFCLCHYLNVERKTMTYLWSFVENAGKLYVTCSERTKQPEKKTTPNRLFCQANAQNGWLQLLMKPGKSFEHFYSSCPSSFFGFKELSKARERESEKTPFQIYFFLVRKFIFDCFQIWMSAHGILCPTVKLHSSASVTLKQTEQICADNAYSLNQI